MLTARDATFDDTQVIRSLYNALISTSNGAWTETLETGSEVADVPAGQPLIIRSLKVDPEIPSHNLHSTTLHADSVEGSEGQTQSPDDPESRFPDPEDNVVVRAS